MALVEQYSALTKEEQKKLSDLEVKWTLYSNCLSVYTEDAAKRDKEIAAENEAHAANVEKINTKYAYILPYLNTPDPDPNPDTEKTEDTENSGGTGNNGNNGNNENAGNTPNT